jgi:DNA-3-methyladenine glycosylase II
VSRIEEHFGGRLPTPAELLAADPGVLRASGMSARKQETLRALAERFVDGRLGDEVLSHMTDDEVEAALTDVPGIGIWTAHGFLLVALDRPDVFLSGDLAIRHVIQRVYEFDHVPTEDETTELADRWRPYRSLAVSYLFASEYERDDEFGGTSRRHWRDSGGAVRSLFAVTAGPELLDQPRMGWRPTKLDACSRCLGALVKKQDLGEIIAKA